MITVICTLITLIFIRFQFNGDGSPPPCNLDCHRTSRRLFLSRFSHHFWIKWAEERPPEFPRVRRREYPSYSTAPSQWKIRSWTSFQSKSSFRRGSRSVVRPALSVTLSLSPARRTRSPSPPTATSLSGIFSFLFPSILHCNFSALNCHHRCLHV